MKQKKMLFDHIHYYVMTVMFRYSSYCGNSRTLLVHITHQTVCHWPTCLQFCVCVCMSRHTYTHIHMVIKTKPRGGMRVDKVCAHRVGPKVNVKDTHRDTCPHFALVQYDASASGVVVC